MMLSNDPDSCQEIEDLLGAYALDALEQSEVEAVESHLESCPRCRQSLAELQQVATLLGAMVRQRVPPASLQPRLVAALSAARQETPLTPLSPGVSRRSLDKVLSRSRSRLTRLLLPLAAALMVVALFAVSLVLYVRVSQRVDRLEQENSAMAAQVARSLAGETYTLNKLQQMLVTDYLLVSPGTETVRLEAVGEEGRSRGVLLVSDDGSRAILIVAGMGQLPVDSVYEVWLMRPGQRVSTGQVTVDSSGWGTIVLQPPESVFKFDWVGLTEEAMGSATPSGEMVLRGRIATKNSIR